MVGRRSLIDRSRFFTFWQCIDEAVNHRTNNFFSQFKCLKMIKVGKRLLKRRTTTAFRKEGRSLFGSYQLSIIRS